MQELEHIESCGRQGPCRRVSAGPGFTLVELLTVIAMIAILAALLLPVLARAKAKGHAITCLSNERQLMLACLVYAGDFEDSLPYNLGYVEIRDRVAQNQFWNWTSPVLDWEKVNSDNTNTVLLTEGGIGPYTSRSFRLYRCPVDSVVSDLQAELGWTARVRSISMNAMVGNVGKFLQAGANLNNPEYRQFLKLVQIPQPAKIFVLTEEHPDSINDGYFLNHVDSLQWQDLPASYHNGAANLAFADGHLETHKWRFASTRPPARPLGAHLPFPVPAGEEADFEWLMDRTTIDSSPPTYPTGY
jgi:prepilin-type N-terminal cleavage/methylation domain-containing protein/prepilin-type processing-associated H-X9-DG protein